MKNTINILLALFGSALIISGCQKSQLSSQPKSSKLQSSSLGSGLKLTASQPETQQGRPDTITLSGLLTSDSVKWSVTPPGSDSVIKRSVTRFILAFKSIGTFKVTATVNGKDTLSASIKVDSAAVLPQSEVPFKTGDQLIITPSIYQSASPDSVGIAFSAQTVDQYSCLNDNIHASWDGHIVDKGFNINYMDVEQANGGWCIPGSRVLSLTNVFVQDAGNPYMVNGTYPLNITFAGTKYTGSVTVSNHAVNFTWNYTSGVTFSTKQVSR